MVLLVLLFLTVATLLFYNYYWKRRNLPPGPAPLPIFGNALTFSRTSEWEKLFLKWRDDYGDVYTYWMGEKPIVSVANYEKIVETFQKDGDAYAGRISNMQELMQLLRGRDFGLGKDLMQQRVLDEVSGMIEDIQKGIAEKADEQNIPRLIDIAVGSIINSLMFGYRFRAEHEHEFSILKKHLDTFIKCVSSPFVLIGLDRPNLLRKLPVFKPHWDAMLQANRGFFDFFDRQIEHHRKEIDFESDSQPTDYVEAFLREQAKQDAEGGQHYFSTIQLKNMCFDLWAAGQETTSTTLSWGVSYMINNPQAQAKLQEELDRVVGSDRIITLADRPSLPYTCAAVNEIQRLCNLVTQNVFHETTRDVIIDGHQIAKGTCIIPAISAVLYDPK
ncbi:Protein CYP-33C1, partial [Aphelenchoides avenae]